MLSFGRKGVKHIKKVGILILALICAGLIVNGIVCKSPYNMLRNVSEDQIVVAQVFVREQGRQPDVTLSQDDQDAVCQLLSNIKRSDVKRIWAGSASAAASERGIYLRLQDGSEILLKSTDIAGQYEISFDWNTSRNYKGRYGVMLPDAQILMERHIAEGNMT